MTTTIKERVRRGALLLDSTTPGWTERIDVKALDLGSCDRCVLGQIFGNYFIGREQLDLFVASWGEWSHTVTASYGFYAAEVPWMPGMTYTEACAIAEHEYIALRAAWIAEIRARLAPQTPDDSDSLWEADPAAVGMGVVACEVP